MHRIMDRVFIFLFLLSWCGVFISFDLVFLYFGVFFQGGPGVSYVLPVWVLFQLTVACWSERISAKSLASSGVFFGTRACGFAVGVWFCIIESSCWGGILCIFYPVRRCVLCYRDIFSVTKLRGFLTCQGEVSDYICSKEVLNWIWNYN